MNELDKVKANLMAEMDRLNSLNCVAHAETVKLEIKKAKALADIGTKIIDIEQAKINEHNMQIDAMKTALKMGFVYKPDGMKLEKLDPKTLGGIK